MQDHHPLMHTPAQPLCQRGVQQPHTVRVREEAAVGDAELRRVSMATQPGKPPQNWGAWAEGGESRGCRRHQARGDGCAGASSCTAQTGKCASSCLGDWQAEPRTEESDFTAKTQSRL